MGSTLAKSKKKAAVQKSMAISKIEPFTLQYVNENWKEHWTNQHHDTLNLALAAINITKTICCIIEEYAIWESEEAMIISRKYEKIDFNKLKHQHLDDIHHLHELRLAVFGKKGVGKSSIVIRRISGIFVDEFDEEIEDNYRKRMAYDNHSFLFDILDTYDDGLPVNQINQQSIRWKTFLDETRLAFVVFDLTDYESWRWINEQFMEFIENNINESSDDRNRNKVIHKNKKYPLIIVGNKCDLLEREIGVNEIKQFIVKYDVPFVECSAATNTNIEKLFYLGYQEAYSQLGISLGETII